MNYKANKIELEEKGYSVLSNLYSDNEIRQILNCIENTERIENSFMKTKDLFAIRQLIKNTPELADLLFNKKLTALLSDLSKSKYFLTKAIYFDKPSKSNWFVAYHQDLSISVDKKANLENYTNWTFKKQQYGVQPPIKILQDTITKFICEVDKGGAMLMKPLTLHASNRTTNGKKRRVIHLEFNKHTLTEPLAWLEHYEIHASTQQFV